MKYDHHYVTVRIYVDDYDILKPAIALSVDDDGMVQCIDYDPVYNNLGYFVVPEADIVDDLGTCDIEFLKPLERLAAELYKLSARDESVNSDFLITLS